MRWYEVSYIARDGEEAGREVLARNEQDARRRMEKSGYDDLLEVRPVGVPVWVKVAAGLLAIGLVAALVIVQGSRN